MKMRYVKASHYLLFSAVLVAGIASPRLCAAMPADVVIATVGKAKNNAVKFLDSLGTISGEFQISKKQGSDFLSGNWDGTGNSPAAIAVARKKVTIQLHSRTGEVLALIQPAQPLKQIHSLVAGDLDNSGADDLAVIGMDGNAHIYLDPGLGSTAIAALALPKVSDYTIASSRSGIVGIAAYQQSTRVLTAFNLNGSAVFSTTLTDPGKGEVLPLALDAFAPTIAIAKDDEVEVFNAAGVRVRTIAMSKNTTALTGNYTGLTGPFGEFIEAAQTGTLTHIDPVTGFTQLATFSVIDPVNQSGCDQSAIEALLQEMSAALASGNFKKVAQISKKLSKTKINPKCIGTPNIGGDFTKTLQQLASVEFARSTIAVHGGAALACDELLPARDGAKRGFVLKNGDYSGKIVAVLPGETPHFESVNVLSSSYNSLESLRYSGLGNPEPDTFIFRQHWRGKRSLAGYPGTIILQGISGSKKYCWKVKKGHSTRVD